MGYAIECLCTQCRRPLATGHNLRVTGIGQGEVSAALEKMP